MAGEETSKKPGKTSKFLKRWVASGEKESGLYLERATCKPNCDSNKGGPPLVTLTLCLVYLFVHLGYQDFQTCFEKNYGVSTFGLFGEAPPLNGSYSIANSSSTTPLPSPAPKSKSRVSRAINKNVKNPSAEFDWYCVEPLAFYPWLRNEVYRYYTHSLIHANNAHLIVNIVVILLAGIPTEIIHDGWVMAGIHFVATIFGAMFNYWTSTTVLVGASATAYAFLMIHTANIVINADVMRSKEFCIRMALNLPLYALFLFDLIMSFTKANQGNISFASHLAGLFVGLFLGVPGLRNMHVQAWEKTLRKVSVVILGIGFLVLFGIQFAKFTVDLRVTAGGQFDALDDFADGNQLNFKSKYISENIVPEQILPPEVPDRNRSQLANLKQMPPGVQKRILKKQEEFLKEQIKKGKNKPLPKTFPSSFSLTNHAACGAMAQSQRDQGGCGSCWAFSAAGVIDTSLCMATNGLSKEFSSTQAIVSCGMADFWENNNVCSGGLPYYGLLEFITNGMISGTDYQNGIKFGYGSGCLSYNSATISSLSAKEACQNFAESPSFQCENYLGMGHTVESSRLGAEPHIRQMQYSYKTAEGITQIKNHLMNYGPVSMLYGIQDSWWAVSNEAWRNGLVYKCPNSGGSGHATTTVGWGTDSNGEEYWLVRNSWGADWGDGGFYRIAINPADSACIWQNADAIYWDCPNGQIAMVEKND